ncbi:MAG: hypothetical protein AB1571_01420 [Nanoarchaeota archaeon]
MINIVFKRYIKKDGKETGPYYYKNIRDENGNVKSIYLGRERKSIIPALSFKVNIIILLLVIIGIILYSNLPKISFNDFIASKASPKAQALEVDQFLIKQLIKQGDVLARQIKLTNLDSKAEAIELSSNLGNLVSISDSSFTLAPRETKTINLDFITKDGSSEFNPNVYAGRLTAISSSQKAEIPIILEIESKEILFDTNLEIQPNDRTIVAGEDLIMNINLFNLKTTYLTNIGLEFYIKDFDNNDIITETENIVLKKKAQFTKIIKIPENIRPGTYVFAAIAKYGSSVGTSTYMFEVKEPEKNIFSVQYLRENPLNSIFIILLLLIIFIVGSYIYFLIGSSVYYKVKHKERRSASILKYTAALLLIIAVILGVIYKKGIISLIQKYWPLLPLKLKYAALSIEQESLVLYNYLHPLAIDFYNSQYFNIAVYTIIGIFALLIIYGVVRKFRKQD